MDKKLTTEGSYANFVEKYMHVNSYQYTRIPLHWFLGDFFKKNLNGVPEKMKQN